MLDLVRIYFARHGESEANVRRVISNRDAPHGLTALGREQAEVLAGRLATSPIGAIYASPILRAVQTAEIVSRHLAVPFEVADALREYDCGVLEGRSDDDAWRIHREFADAWRQGADHSRCPEGGETFLEIRDRFLPFVRQLAQVDAAGAGDVLLITHGGILLLVLPLLLPNVSPALVHAGIGHTDCIVVEQGSGGLRCLRWGDVAPG